MTEPVPIRPGPPIADSGGPGSPVALEDLLVQTARGDREAFAAVYDRSAATVYGVALRVLRDPSHAEEVTQEVMVEIWRLAARFDPARGSARAWIATMAHRRAIDRVRAEQAHRDRQEAASVAGWTREHDEVSEAAEASLEQAAVRRALGSLTPVQREAIDLAYYRGFTHVEVAASLDVPLGTAKARLRDGMIRLRDVMGVSA